MRNPQNDFLQTADTSAGTSKVRGLAILIAVLRASLRPFCN
jgi:hypothetical protein